MSATSRELALYAERDIESDELMHHYARHVCHMTSEGLHGKGDIAAELAYRDMLIDLLATSLRNLVGLTEIAGADIRQYKAALNDARAVIAKASVEPTPKTPLSE